MYGKTGGNRGPRRAAALAVVAAVAVLTACGGSPSSSGGSASTESAAYRAEVAYAHCMQTHGLPGFPDPNPSAGIHISGQLNGNANSPAARANDACQHLLPAGSTGTGSATAPTTASPPGGAAADCPGSLPCYTPRQLRVAYGIQPLLDRGIDGRGVTVALPEEAESGPARPQPVSGLLQAVTDIRQDLADFDSRFGLPPARIQVITTRWSSTGSRSPATRRDPAGTRSPAGVPPTLRSSSPCWPAEAPRNVPGFRGHGPGNPGHLVARRM